MRRPRWSARARRRSIDRDNTRDHGGEWCGLTVDERATLAELEQTLGALDPALALRLSTARAARLRAWFLSPGGTAAGASLLGVGAVGAVWSAWFGLLLAAGSVPAVVDVVETRRRRRPRPRTPRTDRAAG